MTFINPLRSYFICLAALLVLPMFTACGDTSPSELGLSATTGSDSGSGAGSLGGFNPGSAAGGGDGLGFEECATDTATAQSVSVNMLVAVDKSGSMANDDKWTNAKAAFTAFFEDPAADGLSVAARFWPAGDCNRYYCSAEACREPQVPLGSLADDNHQQLLTAAFDYIIPDGGTPMSAALAGATSWATNNQQINGGTERTVVVLLTDGFPEGCNQNTDDIANYAANAFAQSDVLTFAVGLEGSYEDTLNAIAEAGQTQAGYFIGNTSNAQQELLNALLDIQKNSVACSFKMPTSADSDQTVDPEKINVTYTSPNGTTKTLPMLPGPEYCSAQQQGWYYNDPENPTVIELCPSTCDSINLKDGGELNIIVGCASAVPV